MLAWPANSKLAKLANACLPPAASRTAVPAVTTVTLAIQVAAQIGGNARVLLELPIPQRDSIERRSPIPTVDSMWRNGLGRAGSPMRQA